MHARPWGRLQSQIHSLELPDVQVKKKRECAEDVQGCPHHDRVALLHTPAKPGLQVIILQAVFCIAAVEPFS